MSKLGINGFGRIGRLVLRRLLEVDSSLEVVAINDLTSPKVLAYLLKHDSNYGPFPWSVDFTEDALIVNGKTITVYAEKEAQHIPWQVAEVAEACVQPAHWSGDVDTLADMVVKTAQPGDHILVMSNGGFGGIHQKLLDGLAKKAEAAQ